MSGDSFSRRYSIVAEARRRWSEAEKQVIVAEAARPDANISAVARRHGIKPSLLFRWRRMARSTPCNPPEAAFLPVTLALPPTMAEPTVPSADPQPSSSVHKASPPCTDDRIEIELANGRLVRVSAVIDAAALKRILDVLESR